MRGSTNEILDGAPVVVVGRGLNALCWAALLQKQTFTILVSSSEYAVDPYIPAIEGAGLWTENLLIRPRDVLKPGTILDGRILNCEDHQIHIILRNGSSFWLPVSALLNIDSPRFFVNGIDVYENCSCKARTILSNRPERIVLGGHVLSAASAAIETLAAGSPLSLTWAVHPDEHVPADFLQYVGLLGGRIQVEAETVNNPSEQERSLSGCFQQPDAACFHYSLPDYEIDENEELLSRILYSASVLSEVPITHHACSNSDLKNQLPVVLSEKARHRLSRLGITGDEISENTSLEQRIETIQTIIKILQEHR